MLALSMDSKKLLVVVLVLALGAFAYVHSTKQALGGDSEENIAMAKEILRKARRHVVIPDTPPPTVAKVVDVEKLRLQNEFYASAKNGDNLIVTQTRAILYDPDKDIIVDMVPIQMNASGSIASSKGK